jgi:hypothetical protein
MGEPKARFTVGAARRISKAALRVERSRIGDAPEKPSRGAGGVVPCLRAQVTVAIPTGTIDAPSTSGAADIYRWDPEGDGSTPDDSPDWQGVQVCNDHTLSASIAVGKAIKVCWIDGDWWLISADC